MSRKRIAAFIFMYIVIVAAMLFVYLSVQREYGADPDKPYQRKFFIKLPMLERIDSRICDKPSSPWIEVGSYDIKPLNSAREISLRRK